VDVTQVRELEAARQARAVAEEAGRRQQAFMSRMSHELRTPLNAILGFGELLLQGPVAAAQLQAYLGHIVDAGRHMLALVDDLLELQRIEQGRLELRPAPVDVVALLDGCLQMLAPLAARHACALQRQGDAAVVLTTDERALRQIVLNLGSNALKYGGRGGVVALHVQATPDGGLTLHVSDRGPGLTPEQLERLFQPFERLGQERAGIAGSGLGLVITRQLAQALGGTLVLRSTPGQGTVAELRLPPRCTPEAGPAAESGPAHP
jgi:signal transduction histidine kinase